MCAKGFSFILTIRKTKLGVKKAWQIKGCSTFIITSIIDIVIAVIFFFGGYISLLCADKLSKMPFVLRAPAITMPKVLLENVLKTSAKNFKTQEFAVCGFERPIKLPYSFYEELLQQENVFDKHILSPVLIIHGDNDDIVPLADIEDFTASQSNVSLHVINGADHRFKNEGETEKIVELTTAFLCLWFISLLLQIRYYNQSVFYPFPCWRFGGGFCIYCKIFLVLI